MQAINRIHSALKKHGYKPNTSWVTTESETEEERQLDLCLHSERLALTTVLMLTPTGTPVLIFNNLRVCGDCHNALKLISSVINRKITLRDANRFHVFQNGLCDCKDFY